MKSVDWYSSNLNLHIKKSPSCAAFSVAPCTSESTHHTNSHVSSVGCDQSSNSPEMHTSVSTPSPPPLLPISLTSYSCTPLLDHSTPIPTPATRNSHSVDARPKVTMHSLLQAHLSGTHCQSTSEMQQPPIRASQQSDCIFQPRTF